VASDDSLCLKVYDVSRNILAYTSVAMPVENFLHVVCNSNPSLFGVFDSIYEDLHLHIWNCGCVEVGDMGL